MTIDPNGGRRVEAGFDPESEPLPPLREAWFIIPLSCALIAIVYTGQTWLMMSTHGHSFARIFLWQLLVWGLWGAMSPLIVLLARRFPIGGARRLRNVLLHILFSFIFSIVHLRPLAWATYAIHPYAPFPRPASVEVQYSQLVASWLQVDLLLYWAALIWLHLYARTRLRRIREARLQAQLAQAKLEALRLQVHPHFLFNSLNAIAGLVRSNENGAAVRMIAGLSELLRYTLEGRGSDHLASLSDELSFIRRYLEIQKARFGARLSYVVEADTDASRGGIPPLLLQPLAENAVEHGVSAVEGSCEIAVRARRDGPRLIVSVEDNGAGIGSDPERGMGLRNCEERLRTLFGEAASLRLQPREGGGASVVVDIPWQEAQPQAS